MGHVHARAPFAAGLIALALMAAMQTAGAWEPAPDTSARQILNDARLDARNGRLPEAAEKYLWFHEHVLEREPAMVGVRLSFALSDWAALARRYPPAMAQLLAVRDRALAQVDAGGRSGQTALREVIRINTTLNVHESTRDAFERFARRDPVLAERELLDALPALVALNEFELASRHLKVEQILPQVEGQYRLMQDMPLKLPDDQKAQFLSSQQRAVDLKLARVVLVLSNNRRDAEAEQVLARGRALLGPQANLHHMTEALRGVAPPDDAG